MRRREAAVREACKGADGCNDFEHASGHSGGQGCNDFLARGCRYVQRLKAQLRRLPKRCSGAVARAGTLLGRLAAGCAFVKRSATSRRGSAQAATSRCPFAGCVGSAARGCARGAARGHRSSTASAISSRALGATAQATASMISSRARWPCKEKLCKENGRNRPVLVCRSVRHFDVTDEGGGLWIESLRQWPVYQAIASLPAMAVLSRTAVPNGRFIKDFRKDFSPRLGSRT